MPVLDVEFLLQPVSPEQPCGPDLQYDADYMAFETASQGKAEQQYGDTIIPAEPPDWKEVKRLGLGLLERSKDLRVACRVTRASLEIDGLIGFCDGLRLIRSLIEHQWEGVHPLLDPDDDNDPTERVNTLASLADRATTIAELQTTPLVRSMVVGVFSMRDVQISRNEHPPRADEPAPEPSTIAGAFQDCDLETLRAMSEAASSGCDDAVGLEAAVTDKVGAANAMNLEELTKTLRYIRDCLSEHLSDRAPAEEPPAAEAEAAGAATANPGEEATATAAPPVATAGSVEIHTRDDVVKVLDKVCQYYDRYEPSSPLPLLLRRARRLAGKSFLEILEDMSPDGVSQVKMIGGDDAGGGDYPGDDDGESVE